MAALVRILLLLPLLAAAADTATVRILPEDLTPGQAFRMEIAIASTDGFPGPALRMGSELPALDSIPLRFSGQRMGSGNVTTLMVSGVAPERAGDYIIPAFTATLAVRKVQVPATRLTVRPSPDGAPAGFCRVSLEIPDRVLYSGETVPVRVVLGHGEDERVTGLYRIEAGGEGLSCRNTGQDLRPAEGPMRAEIDVTPTRSGELELRVGGTILAEPAGGSGSMRERPFLFTRKLRVMHVPERGRPADWTGAVGKLTAGACTLSNPRPGIGEPTTLTLTVKGSGGLDRILAPEVPHGDNWDVQPASTGSGRVIRGAEQRSFAYTLIPRTTGKITTPAVRMSYFVPETATYERIEFPALEVDVTGQAPAKVELVAIDPAAPAATSGDKPASRATELLDPPAGRGRIVAAGPLLDRLPSLLWAQLAALLALGAALGWAARRDWLARHPELVRRRQARALLRKSRRRLRRARSSGDGPGHAESAVAALRAGAAALGQANDHALTAEDVLRVAPDLASPAAVRAAFRRADGARFGGQLSSDDTLARHADLERCLAQLEARLCD